MASPKGRLVPALPTPIQPDFKVDTGLLHELAQGVLRNGADSAVFFGTTGEGTFFSQKEKREALESLFSAGLSPAQTVVSTGSCTRGEAVELAHWACDTGCAALLLLPPFFVRDASEDGLFEWAASVLEAAEDAQVLLYHIPALAGLGWPAEVVRRLSAEFPGNLAGIKDSTPNAALASELLPEERPGIYVSSEANLRGHLDAGGAGVISASLTLTLPLACAVRDGAKSEAALAAARKLVASSPLIWAVKTLLAHQTGNDTWRRLTPPHMPCTEEQEQRLVKGFASLVASAMQGAE